MLESDQHHRTPDSESAIETASRCLLLFSKTPRPGRVKTRLIGELTPEQAADLHAAFLQDLMDELANGRFTLRVCWALDRDEEIPPSPPAGVRQEGEGLGERLFRALSRAAESFRWVAAVGSDHPELSASLVSGAFDKLDRGSDVVLGPTGDGGYYLIAMNAAAVQPGVFDGIQWSTSTVLESTVAKCRELGLRVEITAMVADVDTPLDLRDLIGRLSSSPDGACPRTRYLLKSWGRLE